MYNTIIVKDTVNNDKNILHIFYFFILLLNNYSSINS